MEALYSMTNILGNFEVYEQDEICGSLLRMISDTTGEGSGWARKPPQMAKNPNLK
jgi:hypothetical protein